MRSRFVDGQAKGIKCCREASNNQVSFMLAKLGIPALALAVALGFTSERAEAKDNHGHGHAYGHYGRGHGGYYGGFYTPYYSPYYDGYDPYFYGYPYSGGFGFYFAPHHHH